MLTCEVYLRMSYTHFNRADDRSMLQPNRVELQQLLIILPKSQKARSTTRQTSCLPVCFPTHWANSLSKFTPPKPPLQTSILCIHFTKAPGPCSVMGAWIQLPETHTCQHCLREHCLCVCYQHIVVPVLISPFLWPVSPL